MKRVNLISAPLSQVRDDHSFRHARLTVGESLGAAHMGATIYELVADAWSSPYHYHTGIEEWLYVATGSPTLRDLGGTQQLSTGDLVSFPSGAAGAHAMKGPGRVIVFSTGGEPFFTAYPDSGKFSTPFGLFRPQDGVDYWDREGTAGPGLPALIEVLDPPPGQQRPIVHAATVATLPVSEGERPGYRHRRRQVGADLGAEMIGATVYELDQGEGTAPYHYEHGCDEWAIVVGGQPTLRGPDGLTVLDAGDLVCFPDGPAGAHRLHNDSAASVRLVIFSTKQIPVSVVYPESGKVLIYSSRDGTDNHMFRISDEIAYWDGEDTV